MVAVGRWRLGANNYASRRDNARSDRSSQARENERHPTSSNLGDLIRRLQDRGAIVAAELTNFSRTKSTGGVLSGRTKPPIDGGHPRLKKSCGLALSGPRGVRKTQLLEISGGPVFPPSEESEEKREET
jgi:hypothetical protein